jgi:hypothetical protein
MPQENMEKKNSQLELSIFSTPKSNSSKIYQNLQFKKKIKNKNKINK